MEIAITKNEELFKTLKTPTFQKEGTSYIYDRLKFPRKLEFNKTYYTYKNNEITAFRIIAYAVTDEKVIYTNKLTPNLTYLVQFPNQSLVWITDFLTEDTLICESKEEIINYPLTKKDLNLEWTYAYYMFSELVYASVISLRGKVWTKKDFAPYNNFHPIMKSFMVINNNVVVLIDNTKEYFLSEEECIKSILNNCIINDFADEPFDVGISVLPNKQKLLRRVFYEENKQDFSGCYGNRYDCCRNSDDSFCS